MASGLSRGAHLLSADSPVPPVSEPRAPDAGRMQVPPGNPLLLSLTLQELLARDAVQVELVPEKKGLFLKHVEYEVSSQVTCGPGGGGRCREDPSACPCVLLRLAAPPPQAPACSHRPRALGSCLSGRVVVPGAQTSWPWAALRCWAVPGEKSVGPAPHIKCTGGTGVGGSPQGVLRPHQGRPKVRARRVPQSWPRWPCAGCPVARWSFVLGLSAVQVGRVVFPGD